MPCHCAQARDRAARVQGPWRRLELADPPSQDGPTQGQRARTDARPAGTTGTSMLPLSTRCACKTSIVTLNRRLVCRHRLSRGLRLVASGRSLVGLARESPPAFGPGLALPGCASRPSAGCGLAQQRRDAQIRVLEVGMPTVVFLIGPTDKDHDVIIGVDPHKLSHTATAVDPLTNMAMASLCIDASLAGYRDLMRWASQFPKRRWVVENAKGLGCTSRSGSSLVMRRSSMSRPRRRLGCGSSRGADVGRTMRSTRPPRPAWLPCRAMHAKRAPTTRPRCSPSSRNGRRTLPRNGFGP
jgi:hypothetical protein